MKRTFTPASRVHKVFAVRENPFLYSGVAAMVSCLSTCLSAGYAWQTWATARDRRNYPPPGQLVKVDGCRLHLQSMGTGSPTVILETGLGGMSCAWGWIQPEMAKFTRVVSYDRAGLGWSDPDRAPITAERVARRLGSLLKGAGIEGPYVLVGHSMGGMFVRAFAHHYPDEVAGMVLIDAAHPEQYWRSPAINKHMSSGFRMLNSIPLLASLGYVRLTGFFDSWAEGLPERQRAEGEAFLSSRRHLETARAESRSWETVCEEVRCTRELGNTPLAVVSAGKGVLPGAPELQGELAALSSDSVHFAIEGADHVTLVTHREHALAIVEAIRQVVEKAAAVPHRQSRLD